MGIMVYSLLWVMQEFYDQAEGLGMFGAQGLGFRGLGFRGMPKTCSSPLLLGCRRP